MIILTKENILSYIKEHVPSLQLKEPVKVSMIGEGDLGEDVEGDGYCNYVFRVSDADGHSYIVKQSTEHLKRRGRALTPTRNRFENLGQRLFLSTFRRCILATRKTMYLLWKMFQILSLFVSR